MHEGGALFVFCVLCASVCCSVLLFVCSLMQFCVSLYALCNLCWGFLDVVLLLLLFFPRHIERISQLLNWKSKQTPFSFCFVCLFAFTTSVNVERFSFSSIFRCL